MVSRIRRDFVPSCLALLSFLALLGVIMLAIALADLVQSGEHGQPLDAVWQATASP